MSPVPTMEDYGFDEFGNLPDDKKPFAGGAGNALFGDVLSSPLLGGEESATAGIPLTGVLTLGDQESPGRLTLVAAPTKGDVFVNSGKTDFTNTDAGFILGIDDSDSDTVKFYLGDSTNYFNWTGSDVNISVSGSDAITVNQGGNIQLLYGGDIEFTSVPAPTALTAALITTAGNVDAGDHKYVVTYVTDFGETDFGTASNEVTNDGSNQQNALSSIPIGAIGDVTARKIYRTKAGNSSNYYLLTTISDNTTTVYTDNTADSSLGASEYQSSRENTTYGKIVVDNNPMLWLSTRNLAMGTNALDSNETGIFNTAVGSHALTANTSGFWNSAFGSNTLSGNTTGGQNNAFGFKALTTNTIGSENNAFGAQALEVNTTGSNNVAIGSFALTDNDTTSNSTAIGYAALANSIANANTALGYNAGNAVTTGSGNVYLGNQAGSQATSSNTLYIENSNSTEPLIYGEFDNNIVRIHGHLELQDDTGTGFAPELRIYDTGNSNYVGFESPALSANQIWVLPTADGAANSMMVTDGSGALSWSTLRNNVNGSFVEAFDADVASAGGTITMTLEKSGTGDLTMQFSDGLTTLDCTSPLQSIALTAGSDSSPQGNWIYILQSDKILTKSTTAWPSAEHIKIGFFFCQSAASMETAGGPIINQNHNNMIMGTDGQGHMNHMAEKIRLLGTTYFSGVDGNGTDGYLTPTASNVELISTSGIVYQFHKQTFPAFDTSTGDTVHVKNWSGDAYHATTNLFDITSDSGGNAIGNNKYFNLVIWGVMNKTGEHQTLMINLPAGFYNGQAAAESDTSGYDDFTVPREFSIDSSTGFLICRITIKMGTTWTVASSVDLRGSTPSTASGGASNVASDFADNVFTVFDNTDNTKVLAFDVGTNLTTGNTRTLTIPDVSTNMWADDGSVPLTANWDVGNFTITANGLTIDGAFTDGTMSITGGNITSVGSITATTFTDGTATLTGGNLTVIGTIGASGDADLLTLTANTLTVAGTVNPTGDTSASDAAAIGYTSVEGLILTGQGSSYDITIKNDADALVMTVATGTTTATFAGTVSAGTLTDGTFSVNGGTITGASMTSGQVSDFGEAVDDRLNATIVAGAGIDTTYNDGLNTLTIDGEAASTTNAGIIEIATGAETNTGTSVTLAVSPDALDDWSGSAQVLTVGILDAGSITANFGSIDVGSDAISTTGVITGGTFDATAATSDGDNSSLGYESAKGAVLTGQGSTDDITFENDAGAKVFGIPTGTTIIDGISEFKFTERADHISTPGAGFGYLWVKSDTPSSLIYTDDAGTDVDLTASSSGATTALDNLASVQINTTLISDTDVTDNLGSGDVRWKDTWFETLSSGLTATDTLKLRGRDVDGAAYVDILTITSANTVTADLSATVTIGGNAILDDTSTVSALTTVGTLAAGNATAIVDTGTVSAEGILELATNAEALAGTDTARAITPEDLEYAREQSGWIPAGETWTYASTTTYTNDNTTYGCTITVPTDATTKYSLGMRVEFTQSTGGTKWGIITKITATVLTVFLGVDSTLVNEAITSPKYSTAKAPFGFDTNPTSWEIYESDGADRTQASPTASVWYNLGAVSIDVPIGVWKAEYKVTCGSIDTSTKGGDVYTTFSTANNTESDKFWTAYSAVYADHATERQDIYYTHRIEGYYQLTADDTLYLNTKTGYTITTLRNYGSLAFTLIRFVCQYL